MPSSPAKIGLALSGGGYRATAFHLGTLRKLHAMGILSRVHVISTISGGSITGACYAIHQGSFDDFYQSLYNGLQQKNVIKKVLLSWLGLRFLFFALLLIGSFYFLFTPYPWLFPIAFVLLILLIIRFQFQLFPISKRIEQIYDSFFYHQAKLDQLPKEPLFVISSTNLQTARPFTFSRNRMGDSTYQFMEDPIKFLPANFPLSRAVMASSCVPFAFTPVTIGKEFFANPEDASRVHPILVDGGVYDNQGIHKVMQAGEFACDTVITSDAGAGSSGELSFKNTFVLLLETVNVFMTRIKRSQMVRNVYDNASAAGKEIAYFSLGWDVERCIQGFITNLSKHQVPRSVIEAHQLLPDWVEKPLDYEVAITGHLKQRTGYPVMNLPCDDEKKIARGVGTNLTSLSKAKVDALIKQAEALTELQVKLYCPSLL